MFFSRGNCFQHSQSFLIILSYSPPLSIPGMGGGIIEREKRSLFINSVELKSKWFRWEVIGALSWKLETGGNFGCRSNKKTFIQLHFTLIHLLSWTKKYLPNIGCFQYTGTGRPIYHYTKYFCIRDKKDEIDQFSFSASKDLKSFPEPSENLSCKVWAGM